MLGELWLFLWAMECWKLLILAVVSCVALVIRLWLLWAVLVFFFYIAPTIFYRTRMYRLERKLWKEDGDSLRVLRRKPATERKGDGINNKGPR